MGVVPTRNAIPRTPTSTNCRQEAQTSLQPLSSSVSNAENNGENTESLDICPFYLDSPSTFTATQMNHLQSLRRTCMKARDGIVLRRHRAPPPPVAIRLFS